VGEDKNLWLPPKTRQCLQMFSGMTAEQIQKKYDILYPQWAEELRTRAKVLTNHRHFALPVPLRMCSSRMLPLHI
jgi:hypothetical protein